MSTMSPVLEAVSGSGGLAATEARSCSSLICALNASRVEAPIRARVPLAYLRRCRLLECDAQSGGAGRSNRSAEANATLLSDNKRGSSNDIVGQSTLRVAQSEHVARCQACGPWSRGSDKQPDTRSNILPCWLLQPLASLQLADRNRAPLLGPIQLSIIVK